MSEYADDRGRMSDSIKIGPADVLVATRNEDGSLNNWINLGFTKGGVTFRYAMGNYRLSADQTGTSTLDILELGGSCNITGKMIATSLDRLHLLYPASSPDYYAGQVMALSFGTTEVGKRLGRTAIAVQLRPLASELEDYSSFITIFRAINTGDMTLPYSLNTEWGVNLNLEGVIDEMRSPGDMLFRIGMPDNTLPGAEPKLKSIEVARMYDTSELPDAYTSTQPIGNVPGLDELPIPGDRTWDLIKKVPEIALSDTLRLIIAARYWEHDFLSMKMGYVWYNVTNAPEVKVRYDNNDKSKFGRFTPKEDYIEFEANDEPPTTGGGAFGMFIKEIVVNAEYQGKKSHIRVRTVEKGGDGDKALPQTKPKGILDEKGLNSRQNKPNQTAKINNNNSNKA